MPQSAGDARSSCVPRVATSKTSPQEMDEAGWQCTLAVASSLVHPESQRFREFDGRLAGFENPGPSDMDDTELLDAQMAPDTYYPDPSADDLDDVEEIVPEYRNGWEMMSSDLSQPFSPDHFDFNLFAPLLNQLKLQNDSAEVLLNTFDKETCGILSIRDGPHENPWRTSILPLVHESEALYHALAAVTAFHCVTLRPGMKRVGVEHIRRSAQLLARDIGHMRPDIALTLTLVLAFAESWDVHVTTGIKHLQGAKQFLQQALPIAQQLGPDHPFSQRIGFLRNTWVYADVISRLTSLDADDSTDFDAAYDADTTIDTDASGNPRIEIDPLMGCAASLFPLIGRAANIVRRVRQSTHNSSPLVSEASGVQSALAHWSPPLCLLEPEDATCLAADAVRTAEAYRWATLLYLHQAVPELPSLPAHELARNALTQVALVPPHSHTSIVHIYPLLAAGCETLHPADREWVVGRWLAMARRMLIGNIDRCVEVVREVWTRRDEARGARGVACSASRNESPSWNLAELERWSLARDLARDLSARDNDTENGAVFWTGALASPPIPNCPQLPNGGSSPDTAARKSHHPEQLPHARTVRGNLHWIGVMEDWNWEGMSCRDPPPGTA
jgi:Fungal specific transcription factor domain